MRQLKCKAPFVAALAVSVLAHALTLSGGWIKRPQSEPEVKAFSATLAALKPMKPQTIAVAVAKLSPVVARSAISPGEVAPVRQPLSQPLSQPVRPSLVAESETTAEVTAPTETNPAAEAPPVPEPVVVATAAPTTLAAESPPSTLPQAARTLPPRGRMSYHLNYIVGGSPLNVGVTEQSWAISGNQYKIDSRSQTTGLARLTRFGPRVYSSSGEIAAHGLQPREFTSSVTVSGNVDNAAARFDWNAQQLSFGRPADKKNATLPLGAQDFISFMYQLSLAPLAASGPGKLQIPITNGVRFETHEFEVRAEEQLETAIGTLRVLPVVQVRKPNAEAMEVWLATEYNYLPVRIRFIGRDGAVGGEQIVTDISVGQN